MPLYTDDDGRVISTHSMLKTFRRCPKQAQYKYVNRLKPRVLGRPLRLGTWMHALQEAHGKGEDWRAKHAELTLQFANLFDEEKDDIGDLPTQCEHLMTSYLWHYKNDPWVVLDNEFILEAELPDGTIYRAKVDKLIENEFGLWLVDHKWHRTIPDSTFRLLDTQSGLYLWAALKNKIPVQGFIWDYGRSKVPTIPTLIKDGTRVSRWETMDTDYPTAARFFKANPQLDLKPYKRKLKYLRGLRYQHGEINASPYFQRRVLEKSPDMLRRIAQEAYHTSRLMHAYFPTDHPDEVERTIDRSCKFQCSYVDLCTTELFGGNTEVVIRGRYDEGDPMYYYNDDQAPDEDEVRV